MLRDTLQLYQQLNKLQREEAL